MIYDKSQWEGVNVEESFDIEIIKAYQKVFTRVVDEGTFMAKHVGDILNSKTEWHQQKIHSSNHPSGWG